MSLTPQIVIQGTLQDIFGDPDSGSLLNVQLCGFGSVLPRVVGTSIIAAVEQTIDCTNGTFSVEIWGNDVITPGGTYYTLQLIDDEGNVLQTAAYQLFGNGTQDISNLVPFVTVALPSYVDLGYSLLEFSVTPIFPPVPAPIATYDLTLMASVTSSSMAQLVAGQVVIFIIRQTTGHFNFVFPATALNAGMVNPAPNSKTVQAFLSDGTNLLAIGPETWD